YERYDECYSDLGYPKENTIAYTAKRTTFTRHYLARWEDIIPQMERRYSETVSDTQKSYYESFMSAIHCPKCDGNRLKPEALAVTVGGKNISEVSDMSIKACKRFFENLELTEREQTIARQIIKEINARLSFLANVGLDYLTLSRAAGTLSGGEAQRIRLATQI